MLPPYSKVHGMRETEQLSFERAAEGVVTSRKDQESFKAKRRMEGFNKESKMWRVADGEHERRLGDGSKRRFIQGKGSTGQDVGDSKERSDWTVGAEGKGVRPGRFSFKGQSLPHLEKIR